MRRRTIRYPVNSVSQIRYKLSVLVCTLPSRVKLLPDIVVELNRQSNGRPVQILYLGDNKSMSVGEKRNLLLSMAGGEYVVFVDDDDWISEDYITTILGELDGCDVLSIDALKIETKNGGEIRTRMIFDTYHGKNYRDKKDLRMIPDHICPIKREIAQTESFPHKNLSEDHQWAEHLLPKLQNQKKLDKILYIYKFNLELSETRD